MRKILLLTLFVSLTFAKELSDMERYGIFLAGKYRLIGQYVDSNITYSGLVTLEYKDGKLLATKSIKDHDYSGRAIIEKPFIESPKVLQISYDSNRSKPLQSTHYIWQTEFDNYARLTGRVIEENEIVAYEALFAIK